MKARLAGRLVWVGRGFLSDGARRAGDRVVF